MRFALDVAFDLTSSIVLNALMLSRLFLFIVVWLLNAMCVMVAEARSDRLQKRIYEGIENTAEA